MKTVQWVHSKLVQPNTIQSLNGPNPFTWATELFPYTVPAGFWLGIIDMSLGSKFTDGGTSPRASMLVLNNVTSVGDNDGSRHFHVPLVIPPGTELTADLINNDLTGQQWMNSVITGLLVPQIAGQTYGDAFTFLFETNTVNVTIPPIEIPPVEVSIPPLSGTITLAP